jgi:hypothetical protein
MKDELRDAILVIGDMAEEQGNEAVATALRLLAKPGMMRLLEDCERMDRPGIKSQLAMTVVNWCQGARSGPLTGFRVEERPELAAIEIYLHYGEFHISYLFSHRDRPERAIHVLDDMADQARRAHEERARRSTLGLSRELDWMPAGWLGRGRFRPVAEPVAEPARKPPETADLDRKPPAG